MAPISHVDFARLHQMEPKLKFVMDPVSGIISLETDPFSSECGRFTVDPEYYGIGVRAANLMRMHNLPIEQAQAVAEERRHRGWSVNRRPRARRPAGTDWTMWALVVVLGSLYVAWVVSWAH